MQIGSPTWRLRKMCPVCEQGQSLAFRSCPGCAEVVVVCEEAGRVIVNPRTLELSAPEIGERSPCPNCGQGRMDEFPPAKDWQIQALGLGPEDYEERLALRPMIHYK